MSRKIKNEQISMYTSRAEFPLNVMELEAIIGAGDKSKAGDKVKISWVDNKNGTDTNEVAVS